MTTETARTKSICDEISSSHQSHEGRLPCRGATVDEQRLGNFRNKLRMRCTKALGDKPIERMLNAEEVAYFEHAVAEVMPASPIRTTNPTSGRRGAPAPSSEEAQ